MQSFLFYFFVPFLDFVVASLFWQLIVRAPSWHWLVHFLPCLKQLQRPSLTQIPLHLQGLSEIGLVFVLPLFVPEVVGTSALAAAAVLLMPSKWQ